MRVLFSIAVLLSAGLLFSVQPMAARWLLPSLGCSPSVWITCAPFFKAVLLAAYASSHLGGRIRCVPVHVPAHPALLVSAVAFLPLALATSASGSITSPRAWLVATLGTGLGVPVL